MSYHDRKYRDLDTSSYDKIMHSTPKKAREEYSSSVSSSYVPSRSTENHISNIGQSDNVSTRGGVTRSVTQSVKKTTSVSSTRSSGYSSEEGKKDDEIGSYDILTTRPAIQSSNDDIFTADKSKQNDLGFQYEDIQSFKDRQKREGDRLEMHRQSLTGNIVGTGKHGAMKSDYGSHSTSYSSALDNKAKDGDASSFNSRVEEYRYSSDRRGSGDNLLSDSKSGDQGAYSSSSDNIFSDRRSSRNAALSRAEELLAEARSRNKNRPSSSSQEFRYSRELSSSKEDILGSDKDKVSGSDRVSSRDDPLSRDYSGIRSSSSHDLKYSRGLSRSVEDILGSPKDKVSGSDRVSSRYDPLSRENLLAEARKEGRVPSSAHPSSSHEFRYSRGLSSSKEDITGTNKERLSSDSRLYSSSSTDDRLGKIGDLGVPKDEGFSRSDALVAKYLHSSRHKGLSKYGVDLDSDSKSHHTPLTGIKEEAAKDDVKIDKIRDYSSSEVKHHSAGGKPMSYLSSSTSYEDLLQRKRDAFAEGREGGDKSDRAKRFSSEIRDDRKSRQDAIDRLLESTRRFKSSESLLDSSSSRDDRYRETKVDEKPDSYKYSSVLKDRDKTDVLGRKDRDVKPIDDRYGSDRISSTGDKDRYQPRSSRDLSSDYKPVGVTTREEQIRKYTESSSYETPYTSLDHSYKPTHYTPGLRGESFEDGRIYDRPLKSGESPDRRYPESKTPKGIYDKLNRGVDQGDKPRQEPGYPGSSAPANRRGSVEGILDEPLYDHLNRKPQTPGSPVPMSDRYSHPLDEYDKPVAVHGRPKDSSKPSEPGDGRIVSRHPDLRDYGISDFRTERGNVKETTRTSITQRKFMSRDGEVIKDETTHHENVHHSGQNALEGTERRESSSDLPTRIQRYPAARADDVSKYRSSTEYTRTTEEDRTRGTDRTRDEKRDVPNDTKLDDILRMAGMKDSGAGSTKYQEQTRKDEVTRVGDDSNIRTRVHRTDVNTNVNIVKEVVKEKPKERKPKSGIAGLKSKIEALTKSVDELMNYKHNTLESYVQEHSDRRPSQDILETLPKPEYYEVKSRRYEPEIKFDQVDYVHKEVEIPESPEKPDITHSELNINKMWMTEDQGTDIGLRIPRQISLISDNKQRDWWNAPTAEEADRFLCIGDWQWWNANTTEGVDNILGIRAINKETGEAGAIIAKYHGEEKPIEWAWFQATQQPNLNQRRRTLTRVLTVEKDKTDGDDWWDAPTAEDADKYLSMGHYKWWDQNTDEGVDKVLGVRGSSEETGTVLATYRDGTHPTAWTWVHTPDEPERPDAQTHLIRRSSRDLYIDETRPDNVELLIRVKDEETTTHQEPRFVAIRPGPVEKAIIVREIQKGDLPQLQNDNEVVIEGAEGEGLEIQDGIIKMRIKDMTPEERKAWVHIMGIEKGFKIDEDEILEIPVRVVDRPKPRREEIPVYAVPMKKQKNKSQVLRSKSTETNGKPKTKDKKEYGSEKKKKLKETDTERKKRELKAKKLEEEKRKQIEKESLKKKKAEEKEKKKEMESLRKKKETDTQKKKKEMESQRKKREKELEKMKERESKKEKKEKLSKKSSGSVSSSSDKSAAPPPTVDRSLKPKSKPKDVIHETHVHESSSVRRSSTDELDSVTGTNRQRGGSKHLKYVEVNAIHHSGTKGTNAKPITQGGSTYSPTRKPGPFAITGKKDRPQTTRGRMTTHTESQNIRTVVEEKETPLKRQSPSVKVVKRINITQGGKTEPDGTVKTEVVRSKSDNLQRRNVGGQIAVPLRGGSKHGNENMQVVTSHQRSQSQKAPGQHIRQTRVEKTQKTYRTETKVVKPNEAGNALPIQTSTALPLERSISEGKTSVIRRDSGDPFNTAPLRRGSGHSVTNVSVKSRSSDGHPNIVQMTRRPSDEKTTPLTRQESSHSVTNVSVSSRSVDGQPSVVRRRSSGDVVDAAPLGRRRSSGHSVKNVSVTSRTTDGQNTVHKVRRTSGDAVNAAPLLRRGSSSHSVTNVSASSHTADGQNTVHKVRRSSGDPVPLDRQGSQQSVTNVSMEGVPLERRGNEFHSVERHSSSKHSNVVNIGRRPSGDPWKVDLSERRGSSENQLESNVSVHATSSSGQQGAGFPPPPNMAMLSGQPPAGFPPPPNMAMMSGQQGAGFPPPPNMAMSSGQQITAMQGGSVRPYGPGGESSSDVSYYTEGRQLPHGYMQKEVRHERRTQWSVEDVPAKDVAPQKLDLYY